MINPLLIIWRRRESHYLASCFQKIFSHTIKKRLTFVMGRTLISKRAFIVIFLHNRIVWLKQGSGKVKNFLLITYQMPIVHWLVQEASLSRYPVVLSLSMEHLVVLPSEKGNWGLMSR